MTVDKDTIREKIDFEPVTIESSETKSAEVDLRGTTLCGLYMPAAFTGTTLTFEAATSSGGTFVPVYDELGNQVSITVSSSRFISLDPAEFAGIQFLKAVSGSSETAARIINLALRSVG
jgi:hypothetical protein